jgi:hypothetical protein
MALNMTNVMNMFRATPAPQSVQLNQNGQPQNPNLQQQQQQQSAQLNPQGGQGNPQNTQEQAPKEQSPEELFKDFWNIDPKKDTVPQDLGQFDFNFDPKKVTETVGTMNFTNGISPELAKKVSAGGEEAVSAMIAMMNSVGQQVMRNAVIASAKVTESGLRSSGQRIASELPGMVRSHTVSNALREDNPLFADPSVAPVLAAFEQQAAIKFPNATPQEIREYTRQYMGNFAKKAASFAGLEVNQQTKKPTIEKTGIQFDWENEPI